MTSAVLGVAWAVLVVVVGAARRPGPRRLPASQPGRAPTPGGAIRGVVTRMGAVVLRPLRRRGGAADEDPALELRVGATVLAFVAGLVVWAPLAPATGAAAWAAPVLHGRRAARRRLAAIEADLPEVADLFLVAVGAGLTVNFAVAAVARRAVGPLGAELRRVLDEVALGCRLSDALDALPGRAGEAVRPLAAALTDAERYGSPLGAGLERLAGEVRRSRQRRAEEAARRVPVKLLFPLVVCVLPAFALLTVAPLIASALRSLRL